MRAPLIEPVLAGYGVPKGSLLDWAAEPKLDGWRARVTVDRGEVVVRSRHGKSIETVPSLRSLLEVGASFVLDGELVAKQGRLSDFYSLAPRLASRSGRGAPGDVLRLRRPLARRRAAHRSAYEDRRKLLVDLALDVPEVTTVPSFPGEDAADLLRACEANGMEGVVLKRLRSIYRPGARSNDWRKVKCAAWREHLEWRRPAR